MRYLSDIDREDIISEYGKIIDGVYTNVCSEFDESVLDITKRCSNALNLLKMNTNKLRVLVNSSDKNDLIGKRIKYPITVDNLRHHLYKKLAESTINQLEQYSLYELYLMDVRNLVGDLDNVFDTKVLLNNYDIYTINDAISSIATTELSVDDDKLTDMKMVNYLIKVYMDYSEIIKWCTETNESTYQKLTEYKQYLIRDINYKIKNTHYKSVYCCTDIIYGILFFSRAYLVTEEVIKFYLSIILLSIELINKFITDKLPTK
jgi:hypothetical protein